MMLGPVGRPARGAPVNPFLVLNLVLMMRRQYKLWILQPLLLLMPHSSCLLTQSSARIIGEGRRKLFDLNRKPIWFIIIRFLFPLVAFIFPHMLSRHHSILLLIEWTYDQCSFVFTDKFTLSFTLLFILCRIFL